MKLSSESYGAMDDGRPVVLCTLESDSGIRVRLTNYGAITVGVETPDRQGRLTDVTLGYDALEQWRTNPAYFGATIGRYANRIAGGRFTLDGRTVEVTTNEGANHLHGGKTGFDQVLWAAEPIEEADAVGVQFTYRSPDGQEGFPGNLDVIATHWLRSDDTFTIEYSATTDAPTIVNLSHHGYWNLRSAAAGDVLGHELELNADAYTPVDEQLIPTGQFKTAVGTPLDFSRARAIGERIGAVPGGYDHNYVIRGVRGDLRLAARLYEPTTGRLMEVFTDQPGLQVYTANFLDGSLVGKGGVAYGRHAGVCLETQHFPDSPNHIPFPPVILRPGERYNHVAIYRFSTDG